MILENSFNLKTFIHSDKAEKLKIDNSQITNEQLENLQRLHELLVHIQARLSIKYARPIQIKINSAFRCVELNKAVGGVQESKGKRGSQHLYGEAADTVAVGVQIEKYYDSLRQLAKDKIILFGQVILEYGKYSDKEIDDWIHISLPRKNHINDFMRSTISNGKRTYVKEQII